MSFYFLFLNYFLWNYYGTYLCREHTVLIILIHTSSGVREESELNHSAIWWPHDCRALLRSL